MARQQLLHFRWRYLHARTIDHFLQPTADPQVAALVQRAKIAGMQPTISINGRRRSLWHSKISGADLIAAHPNLAVLARAHPIAAFRFYDRKLDVGQWLADRLRAIVNIIVQPTLCNDAARLRLSINRREMDPQRMLGRAEEFRRAAHAASSDNP